MNTYTGKEYEMLEACVQMSFLLKAHDFLEVRVINVSINTEQSFEYSLHDLLKVGRKWSSYKISSSCTISRETHMNSFQVDTNFEAVTISILSMYLIIDHFLSP